MGDLDPGAPRGEQGKMRGEQGTESTSLMLSSAEDVSDRRDNSGGARLADIVRTRGEPQGSSQPLSTVWADFWNTPRRISHQGNRNRTDIFFIIIIIIQKFKLRAVCWCSPAGTSLRGRGQKASGPYSCRSCYRGGSGRTAPCLAHLKIEDGKSSRTKRHTPAAASPQQSELYLDFHLRSQSPSLCGSEGRCRDLPLLGCPPRSAGGPSAQKRSDWRPDGHKKVKRLSRDY